jgi:hypothetical protein
MLVGLVQFEVLGIAMQALGLISDISSIRAPLSYRLLPSLGQVVAYRLRKGVEVHAC